MAPTLPIDYNLIRKTLAREVQRVTETICVLEEPTYQGAPRPRLPYFSFKIITPGTMNGDDSEDHVTGNVYNLGGNRKMAVSFHCYAMEQETAYGLMALWQASLGAFLPLQNLRRVGIAVWDVGTVADLSQLLNTGYEGRAQLDVQFGITSNLTQDLGAIETAEITGLVDTDREIVVVGPFVAPQGD